MQMVIRVDPIAILHVGDSWETVGYRARGDGTTEIRLRTVYGVTCIVPQSVIRATLTAEPMPGVRLWASMQSQIGESAGWIELQPGTAADLVYSPRGNERNEAELLLRLPDGIVEEGGIIVVPPIAFGIEQTDVIPGASSPAGTPAKRADHDG